MLSVLKTVLLKSYLFRKIYYPLKFSALSGSNLNDVFIHKSNDAKLTLDNNTLGDPPSFGNNPLIISIQHNSKLNFKKNAFIRSGTKILLQGKSEFELGEGSYINWDSIISGGGNSKIKIGENCAIAFNVQILSNDFHLLTNKGDHNAKKSFGDIDIGDNVWIGAGTIVLKNVTVGKGTVIAAGSILTGGTYPPNSLVAGQPAKVIKQNISWRNLSKNEKKFSF